MPQIRKREASSAPDSQPETQWLPWAAAAAGMSLMFYLDPNRGRKRRHRAIERAVRLRHVSRDFVDKTARDFAHRGQGMVARARQNLAREHVLVDDDVLTARVRSKLGRSVSHPHAIEVICLDGHVVLEGTVHRDESARALREVGKVRGVRSIENRLVPSIPPQHAEQGLRQRRGQTPDVFHSVWSPSTRFSIGVFSISMIYLGSRRRDIAGWGLAAVGVLGLLRTFFNHDFGHIMGWSGGRKLITLRKTIHVRMSPADVFEIWSNIENLHYIMEPVLSVEDMGNGRSLWRVEGPAKIPIRWTAMTTRVVPGELIEWQSVPGSLLPNEGRVLFREDERGGTRIDLGFSYHPPIGMVGHLVATLLGSNPKKRLDDALAQFKSILEEGPSDRQLRRFV